MSIPGISLSGYQYSYAVLGNEQFVDTAVIFVHGFHGDSVKTWLQFQVLVRELQGSFPWWKSCDLYFWSFSSMETRILMGAQDLNGFIKAIYPRPRAGLLGSDLKVLKQLTGLGLSGVDVGQTRAYKKLLLVAHSQGAVLLRRVVLNAYNERFITAAIVGAGSAQQSPDYNVALLNAQLRLFAPALFGASPSGLYGFLMKFWLTRVAIEPFMATGAGFNDLQPSNLGLQQLLDDTQNAAEKHREFNAFQARVLFGKSEDIVHPGAYNCDTVEEYEQSKNHMTVCKPTREYTRPLCFVRYDYSGTR